MNHTNLIVERRFFFIEKITGLISINRLICCIEIQNNVFGWFFKRFDKNFNKSLIDVLA